ncbi:MAG: YbaY family lipoprotein [Steroidobacteraceae bacterium]
MARPITRGLEHIAGLAGLLITFAMLPACSGKESAAPAETSVDSVAGTLIFGELATLSDEAVVEVELADVSVIDGPAEIVSSQRIRKPGPFPVHFKLDYPPERIDKAHRYTVQARIREGDRLAFATDSAYPVITGGNPKTLEVAVIAVGSDGAAEASATASAAPAERPLEGMLVSGGVTSRYSATFRNGALVSLQEDRDAGASGKAGAEYQFKDGRLLRYIELGTQDAPAGKQQVEFDFAFDDTGEVLAARKTVNDKATKPEDADIYAARNRGDLLRNHALALKASRDHGH